jgi:hypothetical protein
MGEGASVDGTHSPALGQSRARVRNISGCKRNITNSGGFVEYLRALLAMKQFCLFALDSENDL